MSQPTENSFDAATNSSLTSGNRDDSAFKSTRSRSRNSMQTIGQHLQRPKGRLAYLVAQSDRLARINRAFLAYLPPHLHDHAALVALSDDAWIIQTDSPAWATRLRYVLPSLRNQLAEFLGADVPPLNIRIKPAAAKSAPPQRRVTLTHENAALIEGAAQAVEDDRLGAALLRLARHAGQRAG